MKRTPVRNEEGRVIGVVVRQDFIKTVKRSIHFLQSPPGWACDREALLQAEHLGATRVVLHDKETGLTHHAPISEFWRAGVPVNRGFGSQLVLKEFHWSVEDPRQPALIR